MVTQRGVPGEALGLEGLAVVAVEKEESAKPPARLLLVARSSSVALGALGFCWFVRSERRVGSTPAPPWIERR